MQRTFVKLGNVVVRTGTVSKLQEGVKPDEVVVIHTDGTSTIARGVTLDKASEMVAWAADDARNLH